MADLYDSIATTEASLQSCQRQATQLDAEIADQVEQLRIIHLDLEGAQDLARARQFEVQSSWFLDSEPSQVDSLTQLYRHHYELYTRTKEWQARCEQTTKELKAKLSADRQHQVIKVQPKQTADLQLQTGEPQMMPQASLMADVPKSQYLVESPEDKQLALSADAQVHIQDLPASQESEDAQMADLQLYPKELQMTQANLMADSLKPQYLVELPEDEQLASAAAKDKLPDLQFQMEEPQMADLQVQREEIQMEMAMTEATEMADRPKHQCLAELPDSEHLASPATKDQTRPQFADNTKLPGKLLQHLADLQSRLGFCPKDLLAATQPTTMPGTQLGQYGRTRFEYHRLCDGIHLQLSWRLGIG